MSEPLTVLQRLREARPREDASPGERCDMCSETIPADHSHVVDIKVRNILCVCRGCYLLFTGEGAGGDHYRSVPDSYRSLPGFRLTPAQWDSLQIPVGIAFFFVNSSLGRVVPFYPGPAGATESLLSVEVWDELVGTDMGLASMLPDVEALLVRVPPDGPNPACYIVPIDACYELVGRLRQLWRGFDGGREAIDAIDSFFRRVEERAR